MVRVTRCCVAVVGLVGLLALAPRAGAAVTVGQLFAPGINCNGTNLVLQLAATSGAAYTIPSDGVIVAWSYTDGSPAQSNLVFKVARNAGDGNFQIVGETPAGTQTASTTNNTPARISVKAGDVIGALFGNGPCLTHTADPGDLVTATVTDVAPPAFASFTSSSGNKVPVAATLEADADGDGYGDETQDKCPGVAGTINGCPPAPPSDKTPPVVSSFAKGAQLSKSGALSFVMTAAEAATGTATGTIGLPKTAKVVRFKTATIKLAPGKLSQITLKLPKRAAKRVSRARKRHALKAHITITVKDAAGNQTVQKLTVKLKRASR